MKVTTNDSKTLVNLARLGVIINVRLIFSVKHWSFMYLIQTTL
jgi:hypothetical protein